MPEITFDHGLYEPYAHAYGADLSLPGLSELLQAATGALDHEAGFFFETIAGQTVLGFLDHHEGRGGSARYFEVFAADSATVGDLSLVSLREQLQAARAGRFAASVASSVTVTVDGLATTPEEQTQDTQWVSEDTTSSENEEAASTPNWASSTDTVAHPNVEPEDLANEDEQASETTDWTGPGATEETPSTTAPTAIEPTLIAEFWERYRRDSLQVTADLETLDRVRQAIDGLHAQLSFVAPMRRETSYFTVVEGEFDETETYHREALVEIVETLQADDSLSITELPSYEDELDRLVTAEREQLPGAEPYQKVVTEVLKRFRTRLQQQLADDAFATDALFEQAYQGQLDGADRTAEDSFTARLRGLTGGEQDDRIGPIVADAEPDAVDPATVEALDAHLETELETLFEDLEAELLDELEATLREQLTATAREEGRTVLDRVDAVKTSHAYEETREN